MQSIRVSSRPHVRVAAAVVAVAWIGVATAQTRPGTVPTPSLPCRDADADGRCSPIEIVRSADAIFAARRAHLADARKRLGDRSEFLPVERDLDDVASLFATAADRLRHGALCDAATAYRSAHSSLRIAGDDLAAAVASIQTTLRSAPDSGPGDDVTASDMRSASLQLRQALVQRALDRAGDAQPFLDAACGAVVRALRVRRRVAVDVRAAARRRGRAAAELHGEAHAALELAWSSARRRDGPRRLRRT